LEVTFELTPDDLWHCALYYRRHKAAIRPTLLYILAGTVGLVCLGVTWVFADLWLRLHQPQWSLLLCLPAAMWLVFRALPPTKKRLVKLHSQHPGFFCEHTYGISPEWLSEKTPVNETKVAWTSLHTIEEDQAYLFLFMSKTNAHVIPKRAFTSQREAQLFGDTARRYLDAAKTRTLVTADDAAVWPPAPRPGA